MRKNHKNSNQKTTAMLVIFVIRRIEKMQYPHHMDTLTAQQQYAIFGE